MCKFATKQRTGVIGVLVGVLRVLISIFDVFGIGVVYLLYLVFSSQKIVDFVCTNYESTVKRQSTFAFSYG